MKTQICKHCHKEFKETSWLIEGKTHCKKCADTYLNGLITHLETKKSPINKAQNR